MRALSLVHTLLVAVTQTGMQRARMTRSARAEWRLAVVGVRGRAGDRVDSFLMPRIFEKRLLGPHQDPLLPGRKPGSATHNAALW